MMPFMSHQVDTLVKVRWKNTLHTYVVSLTTEPMRLLLAFGLFSVEHNAQARGKKKFKDLIKIVNIVSFMLYCPT